MLSILWFAIITILFSGYLVLDGFDFGIGMLISMRKRDELGEKQRRVLLNTIGPVWDGNEVWIITGVGATFAAFPEWYATMLSFYYIPFLVMLLALVLRVVSIDWRGKIESDRWKFWADFGIAFGSWVPAFFWGDVLAAILAGTPSNGDSSLTACLSAIFSPYAILGGLTTLSLLLLHGTVFAALKIQGEFKTEISHKRAPYYILSSVLLAVFLVWTLFREYFTETGKWITISGVVIIAIFWLVLLFALKANRELLSFIGTAIVIIFLTVILFCHNYPLVIMHPETLVSSLTIDQASSSKTTLIIMTCATVILFPLVLIYQAWTYWVFKQRISLQSIPVGTGLAPKLPQGEWRSLFTFLEAGLKKPKSVEELSNDDAY